jgi:hypothetical protein
VTSLILIVINIAIGIVRRRRYGHSVPNLTTVPYFAIELVLILAATISLPTGGFSAAKGTAVHNRTWVPHRARQR